MNDNMKLWESVCMTDPKAVKPITGKSYQGSSPKPYWLIEKATKTFGACGVGWGVIVVKESFQQVSPDDWLHSAIVRVWYEYEGKRGEVEQMGGTKAAYKTNAGKIMVDEDAAKKSVTDGMVKCLSMIGFAGDIFAGRWDDSKYVQHAAETYANEAKVAQQQPMISLAQCEELDQLIVAAGGTVDKFMVKQSIKNLSELTVEQFSKHKVNLTKAIGNISK